jgi:hypothetical protein
VILEGALDTYYALLSTASNPFDLVYSLDDNDIGAEGAAAIGEALKDSKTLTVLR